MKVLSVWLGRWWQRRKQLLLYVCCVCDGLDGTAISRLNHNCQKMHYSRGRAHSAFVDLIRIRIWDKRDQFCCRVCG